MARRFQFNVPDRRGETDPWFTVGTLEVTTTVFVALLAGLSFFVYAVSPRALDVLVLFPQKARQGQLWRIVTWPLVNPPSLLGLLALVIFWWFGRDLEAQMVRRRFLFFVVALVVIGGLVATLVNVALVGFRFVEFGTFIAFVAEHAHARFFFNIPAWVIAIVFVGIDVLQLLGSRDFELLLVEFVIIGSALLISRAYGLASDTPWVPKLKLPGAGSPGPRKKKVKKGRAKLASVPVGVESSNAALDISGQFEMDSLLDKISAGGMESLTSAERKRLEQLSKQLRGK
jgi:membrane associated rhomboid family serine protease